MKHAKLENMIKGWFCGDFDPSVIRSKDFEVAVKYYKKGDFEECHTHKIATEVTVIVEGEVEMNSVLYKKGDIIVMEPGDSTDFKAISDCINVVVKTPSVLGDKYIKETLC